MPKEISENPARAKTRVEINKRILKSGLFATQTVNRVKIPRGVYRLHKTKNILTANLMPDIRVSLFFSELGHILFSYSKKQRPDADIQIEIFADSEINAIKHYLTESCLDEAEIKKFFPALYRRPLKNHIIKKYYATGAFGKTPDRTHINNKLYEPLIAAFKKYIYPEKKTEDIILKHMSHLLTKCKIIKQTDPRKAYEKIRKDIYRATHGRN
jgi:hypothetical protein